MSFDLAVRKRLHQSCLVAEERVRVDVHRLQLPKECSALGHGNDVLAQQVLGNDPIKKSLLVTTVNVRVVEPLLADRVLGLLRVVAFVRNSVGPETNNTRSIAGPGLAGANVLTKREDGYGLARWMWPRREGEECCNMRRAGPIQQRGREAVVSEVDHELVAGRRPVMTFVHRFVGTELPVLGCQRDDRRPYGPE